jgi:hypothetical protein
MIARQSQIDPVMPESTLAASPGTDTAIFTRSLLNIAAEMDAAENALRQEILRAANSGDCARVTAVITAWLSTAPVDVVRELGIQPHMPCLMPPR